MIFKKNKLIQLILEKKAKSGRTKSGRKVPGKYLTKNKSAMKKEIEKYAGKDVYKTKWDADYKSGKGGVGKRYKTKESPATKAYKKMFGESDDLEEAKKGQSSTDKTLAKKAKDSGISKTILKQVHSRGMAAWNSGHRPGTPQNAWAMGRVNSFITGAGGARKADADLWKKAKKSKERKKKRKNKSKKKNESIDRMIIDNGTIVSEGLRYHLDRGIPLINNVYRYGSREFFNLINEVRRLEKDGKIDLSPNDKELVETNIGKYVMVNGKRIWLDIPYEQQQLNEAEYRGKKVKLNKPKRGGSKKFYVYVKNDKGNVVKVNFGDTTGLSVKLKDPERRKSFASRHKCSTKKDKTKAGYWACRIGRYWKSLGGDKNYSGYW